MTDLVFAGSYGPPSGGSVILDFNAALAAELSIGYTLGSVSFDALLGDFPLVSVDYTLGGVTFDANIEWSSGVFRGKTASIGTGYDDRKDYTEATTRAPFSTATPTIKTDSLPYQVAKPIGGHVNGAWSAAPRKQQQRRADWGDADRLRAAFDSLFSASPPKRADRSHRWSVADSRPLAMVGGYRSPGSMYLSKRMPTDQARVTDAGVALPFGVAALMYLQHESFVWGEANPHSWIFGGWPTPPEPPIPIYTPSTTLVFYQTHEDYIGGAILVHGTPCYAWPLSWTPTKLINGTYIVIHAISVKRTADNVNIPVESVALQFDIESWCWSISLSLKAAATMALLEPVAGNPVEVRIDLDGTYITGIIESYGEQRIFGQTSYTASGRSSLALFAAPYAPIKSYTEASIKTAAQLIDHELTGTGWSAAYHASLAMMFAVDWTVPAGAWSYQNKAPIDAVVQIAKAAGARAYADKTAATVHIDPRYPVSPWDWATATVDKTIPISLARSINTRLAPQPAYNQVFVSGTNQGVIVSVSRTGSAGDVPAPMVTDPLMTYPQAGRERGRNILANAGRQSRVTMDLPMNSTTGLIEPGALVQVSDSTPWRGLVVGTSINATHGAISQQIEIERHYA